MEIKIIVPTSLRDIKLSQHQKFLRAIEGLEDEALINRYLVECYCNLPDSVVKNIKKQSYNEIIRDINKVFDHDDLPLITKFKHDGVEYGFVPNMDELTVGEIADLDNYIKDWQNMDKAMSVLYRPIKLKKGGNYIIEDYKEAYGFDIPLDIALGSYFFLGNLLKDLLSYIPKFIGDQVKADPKLLALLKNGDGVNQLQDSLNFLFSNTLKTLQP
jgi:hypothetical protein